MIRASSGAFGENYIVDHYFFEIPVELSLLKASPDKISNLITTIDKTLIDITIFFIHSSTIPMLRMSR